MPDSASTSPTASSQAQNQSVKFSHKMRRRLDHMRDLADGVDQFDMVPRRLSRMYIDGQFPEAKFRLLLCMMSHGSSFHIKRSYLADRFSPKTLAKLIPELIEDGYIEREVLPCPTGSKSNVYHVRSLEHWSIYSQTDNSSLGNYSQGNYSQGNPLKESKGNETKKKKTKEEEEREVTETEAVACGSSATLQVALDPDKQEQVKKDKKPKPEKLEPRKGNPAHHEAVKEMILEAKTAGLKVDPDSLALTVDNCLQKLGATIPIIRETWPLAIVGMLEKGNTRPAAAFFNWMRFEMQQRSRLSQQKQYNPRQKYQIIQKSNDYQVPTEEEQLAQLAQLSKKQ